MAAAFLDLIPETNVKVKEVLELIREEFGVTIEYPITEFTILVGFLLVLLIEQLVLHYQEIWAKQAECSLERGSPLLESSTHYESVPSQEPIMSSGTLKTNCSSSTSSQVSHVHHDDERKDDHADHSHVLLQKSHVHHDDEGSHKHGDHSHVQIHHDDTGSDDHGDHSHVTPAMFQQSVLRSFLLLLALTFHSVFEGIAIGLQEESTSLLSLFIAVIVHKCIMSFSLGLNLAQSRLSVKSYLLCILMFAAASPLGVGIGIGVVGLPDSLAQDISSGILQALAAGTFLYITFFEVLPHELNLPGRRLSKVFFVILGFAIMCILLFVAPHDHGGSHDHKHGGKHQHAGAHKHGNMEHAELNRSFLTEPPPFFESHRMINSELNNEHGNDKHHGHDEHNHGNNDGHKSHEHKHGYNAHENENEHGHGHNENNHGHGEHNHGHDALENKHGHDGEGYADHDNNHNAQTDSHGHHRKDHESHENAKNEYDMHQNENDSYEHDVHDDHHGHEHAHHAHDYGNSTLWDLFGF